MNIPNLRVDMAEKIREGMKGKKIILVGSPLHGKSWLQESFEIARQKELLRMNGFLPTDGSVEVVGVWEDECQDNKAEELLAFAEKLRKCGTLRKPVSNEEISLYYNRLKCELPPKISSGYQYQLTVPKKRESLEGIWNYYKWEAKRKQMINLLQETQLPWCFD